MSALLYFTTALFLLWAADRWAIPIRRWVALIVLLLPLLFTGRALLTDGLYGPFDLAYETEPLLWQRGEHGIFGGYNGFVSDFYTQIFPYRKAVRDALGRGEWPLWNPYTLSGEPLAATAQPAAFSPATLLACLLPVAKSFTYSATLWFFAAALGVYLFCRDIGCCDIASLIGGAAFMAASGIVISIDWPAGQSWVLLPFVFFGIQRLARGPTTLLIGFTLLILAGHPESVVQVVLLGIAYGIFELWRGMPRVKIKNALVAGVLALGLCAIYLLPFREAVQQTEPYRSRTLIFRHAKRTASADQSLVRLATDLIADMQQRVWQKGYGSTLATASTGSIVLAIFVYALIRVRRAEMWFLAGMLVFCLLEHVHSPLENLIQRLPLLDISINDYFVYAAAFAFAAIAAIGVDELQRRRDVVLFSLCGIGTLFVIVVASEAIARNGLIAVNHEMWGQYRHAADVLLLGAAVLLAIARPRIAASAIFVCLLVQRTMQEGGVYPTFPADVAYPPIPLFKAFENVKQPFRIVGTGVVFVPGTNAFYGLEDVRGYSAMTSFRYGLTYELWCRGLPVFINVVDDLTRPFLSFLNVRYAIAPKPFVVPAGWREIARYRGTKILENQNAIDRAFVPKTVHLASEGPLAEMSGATNLADDAWIDAHVQPAVRPNGPGRITNLRRVKLGFAMTAAMDGDGWIVVSEPAWSGWRAYIDGRRVEHQFANVAFIGIYVPPGVHQIQLKYWPRSFVIGRAISSFTLLLIIVLPMRSRRWRWNP